MLTCSKCHNDKDESEFSRNKKRKNGYNNVCKTCKKEYQDNWYQRHKPDQLVRMKNNKNKVRDYVRHIKETTPCTDCGKPYPYYVMDFDHKDDSKKFNLANAMLHGFNKVVEEIKKCDVVCSNCHRERTHKRKMAS